MRQKMSHFGIVLYAGSIGCPPNPDDHRDYCDAILTFHNWSMLAVKEPSAHDPNSGSSMYINKVWQRVLVAVRCLAYTSASAAR